jgi:hypothetical protein
MLIIHVLNWYNKLLENRAVISSLLVGFLLLPYLRMLLFNCQLLNILFLAILIPALSYKIINKKFVADNKIVLGLLFAFFLWTLIGATYSPSKIYLVEKLSRNLMCVFIFLSPVLIKEKEFFIKVLIYSSIIIITIFLAQYILITIQGRLSYSLNFARFAVLIYILLFLYPIFSKNLLNHGLCFLLFNTVLFFQSKGATVSLIVSTFYMLVFNLRKQVKEFFKKNILVKLCLFLIVLTTMLLYVNNHTYRYKYLNLSLLNLSSINQIFSYGNIKKYYFDEKSGLTVEGNKYYISMYFPYALFKSNQISVLAKIKSDIPGSSRIRILDKDKSVFSELHPGDGRERYMSVNHVINKERLPSEDYTVDNDLPSIRIQFLTAEEGNDTSASIKDLEVKDGSYESGKKLLQIDFKNDRPSLIYCEPVNNSYDHRVQKLLLSAHLIFDDALKFLVGWGTASYPLVVFNLDKRDYPHNFIIELLLENGFIGLILYSAFLFACFRQIEKKYIPLFIGLIMLDMFSSTYSEARFLFFFLGFYSLNQKDGTILERKFKMS